MTAYIKTSVYLFLLTVVTLSVALADDDDEGDRLKQCKDAIDRKDYSTAISCLREAVRKEKKDPQGYFWLGNALLLADSTEEALSPLIQARELDTANAKIFETIGDVYTKQNLPAAAILQYQRATELDSTIAEVFVKLARSNMKIKKYNDAANAFWKAIRLDTTNAAVYRELGGLYFVAKQYEKALPLLLRLIALDSNAFKERVQLVKAYFLTKRYEEVIPAAQTVLQKDSSQTEVLRMIGISYIKMKDYENGEKALLIFEQKDTLKAEDYAELAKAQKALEKFDEAISSYEKALRADSTFDEIFYDLGSLYMKKKRYEDAIPMFEKKINADTTSGYRFASHLNAGLCYMQLKDYEKARTHILSSIDVRPEYVQGWSALASCYAQMDSSGPQRVAYKKIVELVTTSENGTMEKYKDQLEEAYRMEGFFLLLDKKYPAAIEKLKQALQLDPKNCQTYVWLVQGFINNKNLDDAKKYCQKGLDICPKNEDLKKLAKALGVGE